MVAPVSAKVKTLKQKDFVPWSGGIANPVSFVRNSSGFVQRRPYTIDTPVRVDTMRRIRGLKDCDGWAESPDVSPAMTAAVNKARAKFVGQLGDSSSFGATLTAEARQTSKMLTSTVLTVVRSAKAVARGNLSKAAELLNFHPPVKTILRSKNRTKVIDTEFDVHTESTLRVNRGKYRKKIIRTEVWVMPNGKQVVKSAANKWLWWSYGVKPLAQDLYNGLDVLQRPLPWQFVKGTGAGTYQWQQGSGASLEVTKHKAFCHVSAYVTVTNPNLWLANQMGLVNPLLWVNEAVPFSFVLDWFSNWSDVLSQYTDFVGLEIARPNTTQVGIINKTGRFIDPYEISFTRFLRSQVIPSVKLQFAYERFSWQRGANAISLLVGGLRNPKRMYA